MEKDSKIVIGAIVILLLAIFVFNSNITGKFTKVTGNVVSNVIRVNDNLVNVEVHGATETLLDGKPAYSFSGDDSVAIPKTSALDVSQENAVTVAAWVKVNGPTVEGTAADILGHTAGGMVSNPYMIRWHDVAKRFYFSISGGKEYQYVRSNVIKYGDVHHVAGTMNSNEICIYLDGIKNCNPRDNTKIPNIAPTVRDLISGAIRPTVYLFDGDIGDLRIYSRGLSETEIASLSAGNAGASGGGGGEPSGGDEAICADSDGLNLGEKGYCEDLKFGKKYYDVCSGPSAIWEPTCNWTNPGFGKYPGTVCNLEYYRCPASYTCVDGVCVRK